MFLDLRSRTFDDASIFHARGTRGFAGATIEAAIDVVDERIANRQPSLVDQQHLVDASAGGIHLRAQHAVGWTLIQAQPAMDADRIEVPRRPVGRRALARLDGCGFTHVEPTTNLPRLKMLLR